MIQKQFHSLFFFLLKSHVLLEISNLAKDTNNSETKAFPNVEKYNKVSIENNLVL